MSSQSHAHAELIEAVGGSLLRQKFGLSPQRLHAWKKRGIPHTHRPAIAQLATLMGKPVPEDFLAPPEGVAA